MHTYASPHTCTMCTYICKHIYTLQYMSTHIHVYMSTYIHTCMYMGTLKTHTCSFVVSVLITALRSYYSVSGSSVLVRPSSILSSPGPQAERSPSTHERLTSALSIQEAGPWQCHCPSVGQWTGPCPSLRLSLLVGRWI